MAMYHQRNLSFQGRSEFVLGIAHLTGVKKELKLTFQSLDSPPLMKAGLRLEFLPCRWAVSTSSCCSLRVEDSYYS